MSARVPHGAARGLAWAVALLGVLLAVATLGCRSSADAPPSDRDAGPPAPPDAGVAASVAAHLGPGSVRCASCHTAADRDRATWKETAMRLGHDIDKALRDRTTCQCCHLGEVRGFGAPIDRMCKECHEDVRVTITTMAGTHCLSCHVPSASGLEMRDSAWECQKCHANAQGHDAAIKVHGSLPCSNCHRPHEEPWTLPRRCVDCHAGHETTHGDAATLTAAGHTLPPDGGAISGAAAECSMCHAPHEIAGAASARCAACHTQREPRVFTQATTFAGGHERCTTCHVPHAAPESGPKECRSCHATVQTMAVGGRAAAPHAKCVNCHEPHDVQSAKTACLGCHTSVHSEHPDPKGTGCVGCHDPHPAAATAMLAAAAGKAASGVVCSHCHTKASSDLAFHAGTTPCEGCHVPHAFKASSPATCADCHKNESAAGAAGGHGQCGNCHAAHEPKAAKPTCGNCHDPEATTAPAGHAVCTQCHDAHPRRRAPKAQCATCHADKKTGPHGPVACTMCHRAHGPDAPAGPPGPAGKPACLGCHAQSKLGSLHAVPAHASSCASCHGAHKPPSAERAVCIVCHEDRKDHEPTARVCNGCHSFSKPR